MQSLIEEVTEEYLKGQAQKFRVRNCVANVREKQKPADIMLEGEYKSWLESTEKGKPDFIGPFGQNERFLSKRDPQELFHLATIYYGWGKYDKAEELYREVLELSKAVLTVKHPDTIKSMIELARTYDAQGRYGEAEKKKIEALKLRQEVFGERDPQTIWAMFHLGTTYYSWRRYDKAEELYREVLQLREAVLTVKHPDTIKSMIELARTYDAQGKAR
ncbi:hypothetical protein CSUB01_12658 [Colletotrichum sublineola]|uniref:Uncharacterized protein n=1 Tax=Colletotrichum sublineola TaxID=1173701 RepID=A0A066XNC8_COLSU|nr:hypothetical protein CSUB01_12658 [Colletotrichum sublineola]